MIEGNGDKSERARIEEQKEQLRQIEEIGREMYEKESHKLAKKFYPVYEHWHLVADYLENSNTVENRYVEEFRSLAERCKDLCDQLLNIEDYLEEEKKMMDYVHELKELKAKERQMLRELRVYGLVIDEYYSSSERKE